MQPVKVNIGGNKTKWSKTKSSVSVYILQYFIPVTCNKNICNKETSANIKKVSRVSSVCVKIILFWLRQCSHVSQDIFPCPRTGLIKWRQISDFRRKHCRLNQISDNNITGTKFQTTKLSSTPNFRQQYRRPHQILDDNVVICKRQ